MRPPATRKLFVWGGCAALILGVALPFNIWRACQSELIWIDEFYSQQLANHTVDEIIDLVQVDAHPPLYYLALKAWNSAARRVHGRETGLGWSRAMNLVWWAMLGLGVLYYLRFRAIRGGGALMLTCVMLSAALSDKLCYLRNYTMCMVALALVFLALLLRYEAGLLARSAPASRRQAFGEWTAYAFFAAIALYTHLLAAPALGIFGALWLFMAWRLRDRDRRFFVHGAVANCAAVLLFAPWLFVVHSQLEFLAMHDLDWATSRTLLNLAKAFYIWYPLGEVASSTPLPLAGHLLGAFTVAVPTVALASVAIRHWMRGSGPPDTCVQEREAVAIWPYALGVAMLFPLTLWGFHRFGVAQVFHAPRYPALTLIIWAIGLADLARWCAARANWRPWVSVLIMLPWLLASAWPLISQHRAAAAFGFDHRTGHARDFLPPAGETIYVSPSELIEWIRPKLPDHEIRRCEELATEALRRANVWLLRITCWTELQPERDTALAALIASGKLADDTGSKQLLAYQRRYELTRLDGYDPESVQQLAKRGWRLKTLPESPDAAARFLPREQRPVDGWHGLECDQNLNAYRWTSRDRARARLSGALQPGSYTLRVAGFGSSTLPPGTPCRVHLEGEGEIASIPLNPGWCDKSIEVKVSGSHIHPVLTIHYPTRRNADKTHASADDRVLGFAVMAISFR